jgi:hypothetical protein
MIRRQEQKLSLIFPDKEVLKKPFWMGLSESAA